MSLTNIWTCYVVKMFIILSYIVSAYIQLCPSWYWGNMNLLDYTLSQCFKTFEKLIYPRKGNRFSSARDQTHDEPDEVPALYLVSWRGTPSWSWAFCVRLLTKLWIIWIHPQIIINDTAGIKKKKNYDDMCKYCRLAMSPAELCVMLEGGKKTKDWYEKGNLKVNLETSRKKHPWLRLLKRTYSSWAWADIKYWA